MKKVFAVMAIVGMFGFVACGPKAEEKSAESTEQVQDAAAAATEATTGAATEVAATTDSTAGAMADTAKAVMAK